MIKVMKQLQEAITDIKIVTASIVVLIKAVFLGVLLKETVSFSLLYSEKIHNWIKYNELCYEAIAVCVTCFAILGVYLFSRGVFSYLLRLVKSGRVDLLLALVFGGWISFLWGGFLTHWSILIITTLSVQQLLTVFFVPFFIGILMLLRWVFWIQKETSSSFIVDLELENKEDDLLNFSKKAENFAERVYNNGSPKSFVFGLDAPWGIGKSTLINFCIKHWEEHYKDEVVVYKYNPLKHSSIKSNMEMFIDGLIRHIQKQAFIPEIRPLITTYSRLLREVNQFSFFGIKIPFTNLDYTVDEAESDLYAVLKRSNKKVIIIVDDLDRLNFDEIKDILFVIRKSFVFPNITYVLCYDTENIGIFEAETPDIEKVSEFFEKFVNIKIGIYLDREDLAKYVSENLEAALAESTADPILVRQAVGGLLDIFNSPEDYHNYLPFIGDIRKLKRFINTAVMLEIETVDFKNSDINKRDLVNLLLIYIHYPSVFRKIYDTETSGGRGFFSLVMWSDDGYPKEDTPHDHHRSKYKNSTYYTEYIESFPSTSGQKFLLDEVFNVDVRLKRLAEKPRYDDDYALVDRIPEDVKTQLACINGGWTNGRNLEDYLRLIVHLSKPLPQNQHKRLANYRDLVMSGQKTIDEVFEEDPFLAEKGAGSRKKLWRMLVNNARKLKPEIATSLINHMLDNAPGYSLLDIKKIDIGYRHDLDMQLTSLINDAGWTDPKGGHSHNTEENIIEAAEWVFGENKHKGTGVIDKLSEPSRGILGIHDLMLFRLFCSADRGGDIFDLTRALSLHGSKEAPTSGSTAVIAQEEMREISQKVFAIFNERYIKTKINIFSETEKLSIDQLAGDYGDYLRTKIDEGVLNKKIVNKTVLELKTRVSSFIVYQLANSEINHGVGCGYYDPTGTKDSHQIREIMNDYLLDICFKLGDDNNPEFFIDYLFRNLASTFASAREDGKGYIPTINEFTKVFTIEKLAKFWEENADEYKALNLESKDKSIQLGDYTLTYKDYIPMIYKVLDENPPKTMELTVAE